MLDFSGPGTLSPGHMAPLTSPLTTVSLARPGPRTRDAWAPDCGLPLPRSRGAAARDAAALPHSSRHRGSRPLVVTPLDTAWVRSQRRSARAEARGQGVSSTRQFRHLLEESPGRELGEEVLKTQFAPFIAHCKINQVTAKC